MKDKNINDSQSEFKFKINGKQYNWANQFINGIEVREVGNVPDTEELLLKINGHSEDQVIENEQIVDLGQPGIEHFYTQSRRYTIIVNGREKNWNQNEITFEQIVILAFGSYDDNKNRVYTVTYKRGVHNAEGTMVKGDKVLVKNRMIFNVTATDKS